jgi:hypothetical protein
MKILLFVLTCPPALALVLTPLALLVIVGGAVARLGTERAR